MEKLKEQVNKEFNLQNYQACINLLIQIQQNSQLNDHDLYQLGLSYLKCQNFKEANKCLEKAIQLDPNQGFFYYCYGASFQFLDKNYEAIEQFNLAIKKGFLDKKVYSDLSFTYYLVGNFYQCIKQIDFAFQETVSLDDLILKGRSLIKLEKYDQAIKIFVEANKIFKDNKYTLSYLALAQYLQGNKSEANQCIQKAISMDENYDHVNLVYGIILYNEKNDEQAFEFLQKSIEQFKARNLQHYVWEPQQLKGKILMKQKKYEQAIDEFKQSLQSVFIEEVKRLIKQDIELCQFNLNDFVNQIGDLSTILIPSNLIGKGTSGSVYVFQCPQKKQFQALKIQMCSQENQLNQIKKEMEIFEDFNKHENLMIFNDVFIFQEPNILGQNIFYFIIQMDYAESVLTKQIEKRIQFHQEKLYQTKENFIKICQDLCEGMGYLFNGITGKKIFHFDIKPDNILYKDGNYKISDFGTSRFQESYIQTMEIDSTVLGTPTYMAPEQRERLQNQKYKEYKNKLDGQKCDIFSIGLTLLQDFLSLEGKQIRGLNDLANGQEAAQKDMTQFLKQVTEPFVNKILTQMLQINPSLRPTYQMVLQEIQNN